MRLGKSVIQAGAFFQFGIIQILLLGERLGGLAAFSAHRINLAGQTRGASDG